MPQYEVQPLLGGDPYTIEADHYSFEETTARHIFTNGTGDSEETLAVQVNVNVRKLPDA